MDYEYGQFCGSAGVLANCSHATNPYIRLDGEWIMNVNNLR